MGGYYNSLDLPLYYIIESYSTNIVIVSRRWCNQGYFRLIAQGVGRGGQAIPQVGLSIVVGVKNYFSFLLVNNRVILLKLVHSKDNRVVSKQYNIGPELFLVSVYIQVELYYISNLLCSITAVSKLQGAGFSKG